MIIQLVNNISLDEIRKIERDLSDTGYRVAHVKTQVRSYLILMGNIEFDIRKIGSLPGVYDIHYVKDSFQLVSRMWKTERTLIDLGDNVSIGGDEIAVIAGPCSIENEGQVERTADFLAANNITIMRGGVFKPRTSPYAYRGGGIEALKMFHGICSKKGLKIISEVMEVNQIDSMEPFVDIFQVGTRNAQNFSLLDALGRCDKPVMLKRGMSGTIEELLQAAEYVFSSGNEKIILCERGIRTFETAYRNTLDLNAVAVLKDKSHLPVIADPSHGIGIRKYVGTMALASLAAGADGIMIEIHPTPENAISDSQQTLSFAEMESLLSKISTFRELFTHKKF